MLRAVLLDLDNTLVLFDELAFYKRYFEAVCPFFADLFPRNAFLERLLSATAALAENDGSRKNSRFFMDRFTDGCSISGEEIWLRFMRFYDEAYGGIESGASAVEGLNEVLDDLRDSGLELVMASNPIYPLAAMATRMAWAGIDMERFRLVTHIDNMSFVKPRMEYYRQACQQIDMPPEACLMVGNDPVNDMSAGLAGLHTFLTTDAGAVDYASLRPDSATRPDDRPPPEPDGTGPFIEVPRMVERLMQG